MTARETFLKRLSDGGPYAFPSTVEIPKEDGAEAVHIPGVTLRDWIAAQAMTGVLANPGTQGVGTEHARAIALSAYDVADAMLAARKTRTPTSEPSAT